MPDLDIQIRAYFDETTVPVSVDEVLAAVPVQPGAPTRRTGWRSGWLIAAAGLATGVIVGAALLLSAAPEGIEDSPSVSSTTQAQPSTTVTTVSVTTLAPPTTVQPVPLSDAEVLLGAVLATVEVTGLDLEGVRSGLEPRLHPAEDLVAALDVRMADASYTVYAFGSVEAATAYLDPLLWCEDDDPGCLAPIELAVGDQAATRTTCGRGCIDWILVRQGRHVIIKQAGDDDPRGIERLSSVVFDFVDDPEAPALELVARPGAPLSPWMIVWGIDLAAPDGGHSQDMGVEYEFAADDVCRFFGSGGFVDAGAFVEFIVTDDQVEVSSPLPERIASVDDPTTSRSGAPTFGQAMDRCWRLGPGLSDGVDEILAGFDPTGFDLTRTTQLADGTWEGIVERWYYSLDARAAEALGLIPSSGFTVRRFDVTLDATRTWILELAFEASGPTAGLADLFLVDVTGFGDVVDMRFDLMDVTGY